MTENLPAPAALNRLCIYGKGVVQDGWGYGAQRRRRNRRASPDRGWGDPVKKPVTVVRWPACPQTTADTSAAVGVLFGLLSALPTDQLEITAAEPVVELLIRHRDDPVASPLPELPHNLLQLTHDHLSRAAFRRQEPDFHLPPLHLGYEELTPQFVDRMRLRVEKDHAANPPVTGPVPGGWICDYSRNERTGNYIGAFYRHTSMSPWQRLVYYVRLSPHAAPLNTGEEAVILLAYLFARLSGDEHPILYNDQRGAGAVLEGLRRDRWERSGKAVRQLAGRLGDEELANLTVHWLPRSHPAARYADAAATWSSGVRRNPAHAQIRRRRLALKDLLAGDVPPLP